MSFLGPLTAVDVYVHVLVCHSTLDHDCNVHASGGFRCVATTNKRAKKAITADSRLEYCTELGAAAF